MKYWPVPDSFIKTIPVKGDPGSFWENRGDRYHCGIDIYAPEGSKVLSIDNGTVIDIGVFTSPDILPYWNTTYYILLKTNKGYFFRFAELSDVTVKINENVDAGQVIGHIGMVLNTKNVTKDSPIYIQDITKRGTSSMLHVEVYKAMPQKSSKYFGGNWFGPTKPKYLVNATEYLKI